MSRPTLNSDTQIVIAPGEHHSITKAAQIMAGDLARILGSGPHTVQAGGTETSGRQILILTASNPQARLQLEAMQVSTEPIDGKWEAYLYAQSEDDLIICGSDPMGTLRAVYAFCRDFLGVDPWIRWTEIMPEKRDAINIELKQTHITASPTFRFRGWFLNNSHLINWNMGEGPLEDFKAKYAGMIDAGLSGAFGRETAEMVAETCLRLEMNFLIPLSCWNIDEDHERRVADICQEYGLFMSFHHLEPVGANLRDWQAFWIARCEPVPEMSFCKHPDKFEIWWKHYIDQWAERERIIWTIGHRGPGDRRFWIADPHEPGNNADRAKAISDAMQLQLRLIKEAMGDREIHYCATLWQEGSELHAEDLLEFPEGTMVIMADHGGKQMMREDFYFTRRRESLKYGVYYHCCYGPGGPHWAQATNPAKMWNNLKKLIDRQETSIALVNTGSIRTYMLGIDAFSGITTRGEQGFVPEAFLNQWCERYFGKRLADRVAQLYASFFYNTIAPWEPGYDGARGFWDTLLQIEINNMITLMYHRNIEAAYEKKGKGMASALEFLRMHRNACGAAIAGWDAICDQARCLESELSGKPLDFFVGNFSCQAELMRGLFHGGLQISRAAIAMIDGELDACIASVRKGRDAIAAGLQYWADNGNRSPFRNWIKHPNQIRGKGIDTIQHCDDLLLSLEQSDLSADEKERLDQVFHIKTPAKWK